jgi:hypothetical protein
MYINYVIILLLSSFICGIILKRELWTLHRYACGNSMVEEQNETRKLSNSTLFSLISCICHSKRYRFYGCYLQYFYLLFYTFII